MDNGSVTTPFRHRRFLTATALFDGHDASINLIRRLLQASGVEVVHLGHNRSADEVVSAAVQEDVQAICISSYQGGHLEYLTYMMDLLRERKSGGIKVFAGGGGVIVPKEINRLHEYGISKVFSPDDGRELGLQGMIDWMLRETAGDSPGNAEQDISELLSEVPVQAKHRALAKLISHMEANGAGEVLTSLQSARAKAGDRKTLAIPVIGVTGTGGAGKSSLVDELVRRFLNAYPDRTIGILSVDPTKMKSGGALLGDRIRMNAAIDPRVYMRSMATRRSGTEISAVTRDATELLRMAGFDLVVVETSGIGQGDSRIASISDVALYVMTSDFGAASQLEKIDMLDAADIVAVNKFDRPGSEDALRDVRKQYQRNRNGMLADDAKVPVFGTTASRFEDPGMNRLFAHLMAAVSAKTGAAWLGRQGGGDAESDMKPKAASSTKAALLPATRTQYLAEIAETVRDYHAFVDEQSGYAERLFQLRGAHELVSSDAESQTLADKLTEWLDTAAGKLDPVCGKLLQEWPSTRESYEREQPAITLSGTRIPKVSLPAYRNEGELLRWLLTENVPGQFPYTAGVFPFKRAEEEPRRQFAGEGTPERTNRRFHFLSENDAAKRLSTAFDSVTLYGMDPARRPDIYGKIGNSGVNVCTIDDMKRLYAGFDLCDPSTSVSMTINGPAPILLAMFLNAAIDQQNGKFAAMNGRQPCGEERDQLVDRTLQTVRGTVQADILKEDQGQNTCLFSTEFALRMMGDVQQYFIDRKVKNYYSVSISGYHIAEAGANPISQLAFTLANGFTYVEYYLSRGMKIDEIAPNLSFFFSNGLDPEYAVMGRAARRIWAVAMQRKYKANARSQRLKYHIQTSGRSLHAQEMNFNDIRTTLQALLAIADNCNSLHTNAYDEAVTTPTEQSVRRAMAIQMIINREFGLTRCDNPLQGSFLIEELTNLVEDAVLEEFVKISERGGVLGAMETQYQRGKIQEESLEYERRKHSGELPIIGVNTFVNPHPVSAAMDDLELSRSSDDEKELQISRVEAFKLAHEHEAELALEKLKDAARSGRNVFAELMETVKAASLGQITNALFEVGGQYRRNM